MSKGEWNNGQMDSEYGSQEYNNQTNNNSQGYYNQLNYNTQFNLNGNMVNSGQGTRKGELKHGDKIFFGVFFGVGIVFLIGGIIWAYYSVQFRKNAVEVGAVITSIEREYNSSSKKYSYHTYVEYEYEGKVYKDIALGYWNSEMYVGQNVTVLCNPDKPYKIQSKSGGFLGPIIMIPMSVVFILIAIFVSKLLKNNASN